MALAFDASASDGVNDTSLTFAHTCTGANRILFVAVGEEQGVTGDSITGVTYAGVGMTLVDKQAINGATLNYWISLWYLIAPATGANNVIVSADETVNIRGVSASYTGVKQTGEPDSSGKATANTTDLSVSTTVVGANCWLISCGQAVGATPAVGTGLTNRGNTLNLRVGDSNATVSTGSNTVHWTVGVANDVNGIVASFLTGSESYTQSLSETITISEPSFLRAFTRTISETLNMSEVFSKSQARLKSFSDSFGSLSDQLTGKKRKGSMFTETSPSAGNNWTRES